MKINERTLFKINQEFSKRAKNLSVSLSNGTKKSDSHVLVDLDLYEIRMSISDLESIIRVMKKHF